MLLWFTFAYAGDVWLTIDARTQSGAVRLDLPAAVLDDAASSTFLVKGEEIDLRSVVSEVAAMPEGGSRTFDATMEDGTAHVQVQHRALAIRTPSRLRVAGVGPGGRAVNLTLPLDGSSLGSATTSRGVRVQGLSLDLEDDAVADIIRRGRPGLLVDVVSPEGGRLKIESQ
jgi:hypothetical protein